MQAFRSTLAWQIYLICILLCYSIARRKLTPDGIYAALVTAVIHMMHPSSAPFILLLTFFAVGTAATRVNHNRKARMTRSSSGGSGGEGPRDASQVLANSGVASGLILWQLCSHRDSEDKTWLLGIAAAYAAATADTLSSELGILSTSTPFLITAPWQRVPRGTNGGVTFGGLGAGLMGATIISIAAYCSLDWFDVSHALCIALMGLLGSILDSVLGSLFQVTVEDKSCGLVVEGDNGRRVAVDEKVHSDGPEIVMSMLVAWLLYTQYVQTTMLKGLITGVVGIASAVAGKVVRKRIKAKNSNDGPIETIDDPAIASATANVTAERKGKTGAEWQRRGRDVLNNNGVNFAMTLVIALAAIEIMPAIATL